jgi:hypothetical protein
MGTEEIRKQIDQELHEAEQLVLRLRSKRNTLAPVCRLPTDILCQIFYEIALPPPHDHCTSALCHHDDHDMLAQYKWITITHVCRRFRHVAIAYPILWTCLPLYSTPLHRTFLKRSKGAPGLCLHMQQDTRRASRLIRNVNFTIKTFMHRVGILNIIASAEDLEEFFSRTKSAAPNLEELSLTNTSSEDEPLNLPVTLFAGQAPRLRTMQLNNIFINGPSALHISGLTKLKICYAEHFPMICVLGILSANPNLEVLILDCPQFCFPTTQIKLDPISLPVLESFFLAGEASVCAALMKVLILPASASFSLRCLLERPASLMDVTPIIVEHTMRDRSIVVDTISIVHSDESGHDMLQVGSLHLLKRASTPGHAERFVHIFFELTSEELPLRRHVLLENILSLCTMLPLSSLQHVSLAGLRSQNIVRELSTEPQTFSRQTISIYGNPSFPLIRAVIDPESRFWMSFLPNAQSLHLEGTNFIQGINPLDEDDEDFIDLLADLLEGGTSINILKIVKSKAVSREMVRRLEESVDTVICDELHAPVTTEPYPGFDENSSPVPPLPPCPIQ